MIVTLSLKKKFKEGGAMKRILFGWIEQIIEFDSEEERQEIIH